MNTEDLCNLVYFDEDSIFNVIKERYELDNMYTYVGDILLAVNPFKELEIYSKEYFEECKKKCRRPAHIFHLSSQVYQSMLITSESQCFIMSGESGSGKTHTTKNIMKHFLSLCSMDERKLQEKIEMANNIMEVFGSAKTSLNRSSTRYVKFVQIFFSNDKKVFGSNITQYLLEKSRVTNQKNGERNFHIFYYLFAGRTEEELSKQLLHSPTKYRYLKYCSGFGNDLITWSQSYNILLEEMYVVGFSYEDICGVFGILSAILNLGEIKFGVHSNDESVVYIENLNVLDRVAILLGVDADDLELCLTSNLLSVSDNEVSSFKNTPEANACREALAQVLYTRLFGWLVYRINEFLCSQDGKKRRSEYLSIGFLDMFGFEDVERNSIEQLCINVANEQVQLHFTQNVFALEQVEYEQEEVKMETFHYTNNKNIVNLLLEKPHGIFALLEEESKCFQANENTFLSSLNAHCSQHENYISSDTKAPIFSIVHYTQKVSYAVDGILQKNNDQLDLSVIDCLKHSDDKLVSSLFHSSLLRTGSLGFKSGTGNLCCCHGDLRELFNKKQKQRLENKCDGGTHKMSHNINRKRKKMTSTLHKGKVIPSVVTQFRNSLVDLMEKILLFQAHFVRCIKPNKTQNSDALDPQFVINQIKYLEVVETVKIRKFGFPFRLLFKTFLDRYQILAQTPLLNVEPTAENCRKLLDAYQIECKTGKSKVFLQLKEVERLSYELNRLTSKVVTAQKMVRGHLARIDFHFLQTNRKQEERNLGNLLVSISSKSAKAFDNLSLLNDVDIKIKQERNEKSESKRKESEKENQIQKRKLTNNATDVSNTDQARGAVISDNSPTRKFPKNKPRSSSDVVVRNFTQSSMSAWCRVDCYERQYHIASFEMDQAVICVDGTYPLSDKNRIAFAALQSRWDDPKVAKVKSCIGKGVQMHQDEKQNLWATRLGKNPIFARGHTLCPELVRLNGKLTQGVPMKVLDTAAFKEDMKQEVDANGVNDEVKEKIMSRLKVCMSFIKDTVVDEETPCWFEIWLLKVKESVKRYFDNYQKRHEHEEKRKSLRSIHSSHLVQSLDATTTRNAVVAPSMRRAKSGDQLKTSERRGRAQSVNQCGGDSPATKVSRSTTVQHNDGPPMRERRPPTQAQSFERTIDTPPPHKQLPSDGMRREKSMDVRLEQRLLRGDRVCDSSRPTPKKVSSAHNSPQQSIDYSAGVVTSSNIAQEQLDRRIKSSRFNDSPNSNGSPENSMRNNHLDGDTKRATYVTPKAGMSYRQVFDIQSSDYIFNVSPPNFTRHRRFSDSDTESLQNFVSRSIVPQDDKPKVLQQPKKWMKKVRRKSEDQSKRKDGSPTIK